MKKYLLLFCLLPLYFIGHAQCDNCTNDVLIDSLIQCSPAFFDLTDIESSLPVTGSSYNYYEVCNNGNGNLATSITTNCNGGNANKCVTHFDPDEDVDNIIYVEVLNGGNCDTTFKFKLVELATPTIAVNTATGPSSCGQSNGSISFNFMNVPDGSDTIFWDGGSQITTINSGFGTIINLDNITYNNFKINVGGCDSQEDVDVTLNDPPGPTPTITGPTSVCSGGQVMLNAGGGFSNYSWSNGGGNMQNATYTNITMASTFTVTVTDNSMCTGTDTHMVTVNSIPTATAGSNSPVCAGATIELTGGGGGAGGTYSWTGPGGYTSNMQNPTRPNATTNMSGDYTVTAMNSNGCTDTETVNVVVNPKPVATASSNSPVCAGATITLMGGGAASGGTYSWTGPGGYTSNMQNPTRPNSTEAMSGSYTVSVTNPSGCSNTKSIDVVVNPNPSATASSNSPVCEGETINLMGGGAGGGTYSWSGPNSFTSNMQNPSIPNATSAMTGSYTVVVTDTNNCSASNNTNVVVNAKPTASSSSNSPVCTGDNIVLMSSGGGNGGTYSWAGPNGYTSNMQNPIRTNATTMMTGTYIVTVFNNLNCSDVSMTQVAVNARPTLVVNNTTNPSSCGGSDGKIDLVFTGVPNGMHLISWAAGSQTIQVTSNMGSITGLSAGSYENLTIVINNCGNLATPNAVLQDPNSPAPGTPTGTNPTTCTGNDGSISIPNLLPGETYQVTYTDDGNPVGPINLTANGSGIIMITGLNAGLYASFNFNLANCTGSANGSVTLSDPQAPTPGNPSKTNPTTCGGTDGSISIPGLMPSTQYSVTYNDDGNTVGPINLTSNGSGIVIIGSLNAGNYTNFSFTLNGCMGQNNQVVILEDPNSPTCSASSNSPLCEGSTLNLTGNTNASGGGVTFSWTGPNGFSSSMQNPSIPNASVNATGPYTFTVTKNGCVCSSMTNVVVNPKITIDGETIAEPLCNGESNGSISLNVSGGSPPLVYSWNGGLMGNPLQNLGAGTYTVTITDQSGVCTATQTYMLDQPDPILISSAQIIKSCADTPTGSINITVSGGVVAGDYNFLWSNADVTEDLNGVSAGTYTVIVSDDNGCNVSDDYAVGAFPIINTTISGDLSFCEGTVGEICAADNAIYTWKWNDNSTDRCLDVMSQGTFTVTITQNNPGNQNCTAEAVANVLEITNPIPEIEVSDPDGDSTTDGKLCLGSVATITASASNYASSNLLFEWSNDSNDDNIIAASSGTYTVTISENISGINCSDEIGQAITVWTPPSVSNLDQLNSTNFVGELMIFGANIQENDNMIATDGYMWQLLPDGTVQNPPANEQPQLNVIFPTDDQKIINLTVVDVEGCPSELATFPKYVSNPDDCLITNLSFSSNTICAGDNITVEASAKRSLSASEITSYEYFIDDVSQGINVVNFTGPEFMNTTDLGTFNIPGTYKVEFQIVDNGFPNCSASLPKTFSVKPNPSITIQQESVSGCAGVPIQLNYTIQYYAGFPKPPLKITFNDGEGTDIVKTTPGNSDSGVFSIAFEKAGTYTVTSIVDETDKYCDVIDNFDSFEVNIFDALTAIDAGLECNSTGDLFTYSFEITGGDGNYSLVSGVGPDDNIQEIGGKFIYTSDTLDNGSAVNVTISDGSSCANLVFFSQGTNNVCNCSLDPNTGAILLDTQNESGNVCESDTVYFTHDYLGIPADLVGTVEIWYYVVESLPFDPDTLTHIYKTNETFIALPAEGIQTNVTYSIVPVIGYPKAEGGIDFDATVCLAYEGDANQFRFFSDPKPQVAVDNNMICENSSNKVFEAVNLLGNPNDNVLWSLDGGEDKHFYPSAADKKVYISFPDSLFTSGETVTITLTESKQYTAVQGVCTGDTSYTFTISEQKAPNQGEIYWWPGDILVSSIQDACYQWGFISNGTEQSLTDGDDDRFLFVPGGIAEIDQTETPDKIYFVDIFFKDGAECNSANECKTRTYYNTQGPPQLQIGHGDENEFLVYPNPSDNIFNLRVRGDWGGKYTLEIYTQMGRRVQVQTMEKNYWTLTGTIDLSDQSAGIYYLVSTNDAGERKVVKIVKTL